MASSILSLIGFPSSSINGQSLSSPADFTQSKIDGCRALFEFGSSRYSPRRLRSAAYFIDIFYDNMRVNILEQISTVFNGWYTKFKGINAQKRSDHTLSPNFKRII